MSQLNTLFASLVSFTVVSMIVLAVGSLITRILHQPIEKVRCIQWTLAALMLAVAIRQAALLPTLSINVFPPPFERANKAQTQLSQVSELSTKPDQILQATASGQATPQLELPQDPTHVSAPLRTSSVTAANTNRVSFTVWQVFQITCLAISAVGAFWFVLLLIIGRWRLTLLLRECVPASESLLANWREWENAKARNTRVLISQKSDIPLTCGVREPVIILPERLATGSNQHSVEYCLSHEWAHVKNRDIVMWWILHAMQPLLWFQPAFWHLRRELRMAHDQLADDFAAGRSANRADYAELLMGLAAPRATALSGLALTMADRKSSLYRRVEMLLTNPCRLAQAARQRVIITLVVGMSLVAISLGVVRLERATARQRPGGRPPIGRNSDKLVERGGLLSESLSKVAAAWKRRETGTQRLYCKWTAETTWPAKSFGHDGFSVGKVIVGPSQEPVITETLECSLDGDWLRFSHSGPKWSDNAGKFMPRMHLTLTNDDATLTFFGGDGFGGEFFHPVAFLDKPGRSSSSDHMQLTPLSLIFRPLSSQLGEAFDLSSFERVDGNASHGNPKDFVIRQIARDESRPNYIFWLDEDRDFLPTKVEMHSGGGLLMEITITYQEEEDNEWVPEKWSTIIYSSLQNLQSPPRIQVSTRGRVIRCVPNPVLSDIDFTFPLPGGTVVTDSRADEYYVLKQDGTKRDITEDERVPDVTYADLVATDSGKAVSPVFKALVARIGILGDESQETQRRIVEDIKNYFDSSQNAAATAYLANVAAARLMASNNTPAAVATLRAVADALGEGWEHVADLADRIEGSERLDNSVGKKLEVTGITLNGDEFDQDSMRGKVVLVTFWHMGCRPCVEELAVLNRVYQNQHEKGFDIVGVTSDADADSIKEFLNDRAVSWVNLYRHNDGPQSTMRRYGISAFPTNVLVDRDGRVVSVSNDCSKLHDRVSELVSRPRKPR